MEQKKPYHLLAFEKAIEEGRIVIDKRDGREHRRFNVTLRPSQVAKSFKDCLNKNELDDYSEKELILIAKKLIDLLIKKNGINSDILYRHFRGRLEKFYKDRTRQRRIGR